MYANHIALRISWIALLLTLLPGSAAAQSGSHGYLFGGAGSSNLTDSPTVGYNFGVGGEYRIKRFGIGAEIGGVSVRRTLSGLETKRSLAALGALNATYHFRSGKRGSRVRDPFVTGGISVLNGTNGFYQYGGGMNYWFKKRAGLRFEFRDHIDGDSNHILQFRVGITFR